MMAITVCVAVNVTSARPPTLSKDEITATCFKDVWCNSDHDDSSKTHLLRGGELVGRGLKAVIVECMSTHSHMLFTEIILSRHKL